MMNRQQIEITFTDGITERHTIGGLCTGAGLEDGLLALFIKTSNNSEIVHIGTYPIHNIRKWVIWDI